MHLSIVPFSSLCGLEKFVINGIQADQDDFGEQEDRSPETAEPYCCGDMTFTASEPKQEVLDKYQISEEDYWVVANRLEEALSFGSCCWCS